MAISHWPKEERPREKLLSKGAAALSDAELLAIFLRTGLPGITAIDLARALLSEFGSIGALLSARQDAFCERKGLGPAKFAQLQAALELTSRYIKEELRANPIFTSPQMVRDYLAVQMRGYQREVFVILLLDSRHQLLDFHELFQGTIDMASVYPREIVKLALQNNAAAVIVAHNHPSGVAEPSQSDIAITKRIKQALALVDIRLLDHFIIGRGAVTSLADTGRV
ncbi:MAG: DNA repair protein RadC [Parasphingorhabdus sp.]|jgi:DNA repair protein RadC|tara:strand:- start:63 stop:737 length:675 start_codon:yes stop_codon:yes gene_type:complete